MNLFKLLSLHIKKIVVLQILQYLLNEVSITTTEMCMIENIQFNNTLMPCILLSMFTRVKKQSLNIFFQVYVLCKHAEEPPH